MSNQRQKVRTQIIKICDETIADFVRIKQTALHMDLQTIRIVESVTINRFKLLKTIYTQLSVMGSNKPYHTHPASIDPFE